MIDMNVHAPTPPPGPHCNGDKDKRYKCLYVLPTRISNKPLMLGIRSRPPISSYEEKLKSKTGRGSKSG